MKIYTRKPRFSSKGKRVGFISTHKYDRCDFTGKILHPDLPGEGHGSAKFKLDYNSDDALWDEREREFGQKYRIDVSDFLGDDPYVFESEAERSMTISGPFGFAFRGMRIETATRLIESGVITPDQLSGYHG